MNDNSNLINLIQQIATREICSEEELLIFLPSYPTLRGDEFIFTIGWANAKKFISKDADLIIRGLHFIEMKHKQLSKNNFGFGSPSPTAKLIKSLEKENPELATQLEKWIADNGGNYYISQSK